MGYANTQSISTGTPREAPPARDLDDCDLLVFGGTIACLVSALKSAQAGARVKLLVPPKGIGSGFAPLRKGSYLLDVGCRRFDLTNDPEILSFEDYQPGARTRPFANHYRSFLEEDLELELVETPAPTAAFDGKHVPDFVTSLDLRSLRDIMSADDLDAVLDETGSILAHPERSPLAMGFGAWPDLSNATLKDASIANHGRTLHERLIKPYAEKLFPGSWESMPADLAQKIWAPLFFPRTVYQGCMGEIDRDRPAITYFYPASGYFGEFVAKLLEKVRRHPGIQTQTCSQLQSLDQQGFATYATLQGGETLRWTRPYVLGASVDSYLNLAGAGGNTDKMGLALIWVEVAEADILTDPSMINVFDGTTPVSRISYGGTGCKDGNRILTLEMSAVASACTLSASTDTLNRLNILRPGAPVKLIHREQNLSLFAPTARNRQMLDTAKQRLKSRDVTPNLVGPLTNMKADTLCDQILQGLRLAASL